MQRILGPRQIVMAFRLFEAELPEFHVDVYDLVRARIQPDLTNHIAATNFGTHRDQGFLKMDVVGRSFPFRMVKQNSNASALIEADVFDNSIRCSEDGVSFRPCLEVDPAMATVSPEREPIIASTNAHVSRVLRQDNRARAGGCRHECDR